MKSRMKKMRIIENMASPWISQATLTKITNYTFTPLPIFITYSVYSTMKQLIHDQKIQLLPDFFLNLCFYRNVDMSNSRWGDLLC